MPELLEVLLTIRRYTSALLYIFYVWLQLWCVLHVLSMYFKFVLL